MRIPRVSNPLTHTVEAVTRRPAVGKGGEHKEARHEAEGTSRQGVYRLDREEVLRVAHGSHQGQHLTTER